MNKKNLSIILTLTIILTSLTSCENAGKVKELVGNLNKKQAQAEETTTISIESPYYYVTVGSVIKERNHYMELEVKIPKIGYSNEDSDPVFDPINEEIENTITKLIEESKENAYNTYMSYLETAKTNIENEKAKKIEALKKKYKSILGEDEVKAIAKLSGESVIMDASPSDIEINDFTSTEDIINAGPHNKRIIVVDDKDDDDATNNEMKKAKIEINGKPGRKNLGQDANKQQIEIKETKTNTISSKSNIDTTSAKKETSASKETDENNNKPKYGKEALEKGEFGRFTRFASDSDIKKPHGFEITDEITLENFYKELLLIRMMRVPNARMLTREYIPMYIYCDFDVDCVDEDYISVYIEIDETRAQSMSKILHYNIDLKNKKILTIKDLLGEDFKTICVDSITKAIDNWPEEKKAFLNPDYNVEKFIDEDIPFFINNNHMPVVVFDKYAITAGAAGYPEFQIVK